ncbi:hypothetical protein E3N88_39790 [Mikania micrantha]|uniref:Uncharacterized protein n=1 Tax=Mikania micrantha TaxID=192012 RepID=A0A5N6LKS2_9ASTR|nr:hypothetical protein E3N88_39790 [Mikania micrantha]
MWTEGDFYLGPRIHDLTDTNRWAKQDVGQTRMLGRIIIWARMSATGRMNAWWSGARLLGEDRRTWWSNEVASGCDFLVLRLNSNTMDKWVVAKELKPTNEGDGHSTVSTFGRVWACFGRTTAQMGSKTKG